MFHFGETCRMLAIQLPRLANTNSHTQLIDAHPFGARHVPNIVAPILSNYLQMLHFVTLFCYNLYQLVEYKYYSRTWKSSVCLIFDDILSEKKSVQIK